MIEKINSNLGSDDKKFLLSFFEGMPDWNLFRESHAQELPAIKWKLKNIQKMNAVKKTEAVDLLKQVLNI